MSHSIEHFTKPLSPAEAFCIGGIVSSCDVHRIDSRTSAWGLHVTHNPQKATPENLSMHKKYLQVIFSNIPSKVIVKGETDYKKYMRLNKDGFLFLFKSEIIHTPEDLIKHFTTDILSSDETIRCAFLSGAFDGRSSWDKSSKMITLDCCNELCQQTICSVIDSLTLNIKYNYNPSRKRSQGQGNPRKAQLRICSASVPTFIKKAGLISPTRIAYIENASLCNYIEESDKTLRGLTKILGLRLSKQTRKFATLSPDTASIESSFDNDLLNKIENEVIKVSTKQPAYHGKPEKKKEPIKFSSIEVYPRNASTALNALRLAKYKCEIDSKHPTFIRKRNNLPYTEPHHLIPLAYFDSFDFSLDVIENIVSLCSHCHNQIHYDKDAELLLRPLYEQRKDLLASKGLYIKYAELLKMYK